MPVLPLHFRTHCLHFLFFLSLCYFALLLTSAVSDTFVYLQLYLCIMSLHFCNLSVLLFSTVFPSFFSLIIQLISLVIFLIYAITHSSFISPSLCIISPSGIPSLTYKKHSTVHSKLNSIFNVFVWFLILSWQPLKCESSSLSLSATGQPSSHCTKRAKLLAAITTTQAACFWPGSATTRAGFPRTSFVSTNGTPCRMSSRTVQTHLFSSQICE